MDVKKIRGWNGKNTDTSGLKDGQMAIGYFINKAKGKGNNFLILKWDIKLKEWVWTYNMRNFKCGICCEVCSFPENPDFWIKFDPPKENKNGY